MAKSLQDAVDLGARESFLAVVATVRADGTVQASLVNAGVLRHPTTGQQVVGFVTYGPTKLRNLRSRPQLAVTFRSGWSWVTVEGHAQLVGPDDPDPAVNADRLRLLLREVFAAAGGTHDDWEAYDRAMAEERRTAVLVGPERVYGV
jgi:PPOX class probable F420-dependent enzyme